MASLGVRELRDGLSRYVRRAEAGERIAVTAHGRVVAELGPPPRSALARAGTAYGELVASGLARPPLERGDPLELWPRLRLPPGTAAALIDADRGET
jgi:antitoxin (DNA-binding transcriptional repressor) of toxin-antitoxin stability system